MSGSHRTCAQVRLPTACALTTNDVYTPWLNLVGLKVPHHATVVVVPPHLHEFSSLMPEDGRVTSVRSEQSIGFSSSVGRDRNCGEKPICFGMKLFEARRNVEAVH